MISNNIINFLEELSRNNNREWFLAHHDAYQESLSEIKELTSTLLSEIQKIDKRLVGVNSKDCIFRIYRDIRFSKDKTPYKNHFGIYFAPGGKNSSKPGYYLHIEPNESFFGGGAWMSPTNELFAIRQEIYYNYLTYKTIVEEPDFANEFPNLDSTYINKKAPKGFDPNFEGIEILKHKSFFFFQKITNDELSSPHCKEKIVRLFQMLQPFNAFLNSAIE